MKKSLRIVAPVSGILLAAALLGPASPAVAESGVPCVGGGLCTDTFNVTGEVEFWTVPNGVEEIALGVLAGSGGGSEGGGQGGDGGGVFGWADVNPGDELALIVGEEGATAPYAGAAFGGGDGSVGEYSGGGGGGSFVFIREAGGSWEPLLIAGGGGGASSDGGANVHDGGDGGYSAGTPNAEGATLAHAAGGTTTEAGYPGGNVATFDGSLFEPGFGQSIETSDVSGGGGGGYYGGGAEDYFAGGGGSGYASLDHFVDPPAGFSNVGAGQIEVRYQNDALSEASLSVQPSDPVVGSPVTLEGTVTQYNGDWGKGTLHFSASLDGDVVHTASIEVDVDSGAGPWTGLAATSFIPGIAGEYTFSLWYEEEDFGEHIDAFAADVVLLVGAAPPTPPTPPSDAPDELAETGAPAGVALGVVGAGLLSGGAILFLLRRRTRS